MHLENFLIKGFDNQDIKDYYNIAVPIGSKFLMCKAVPDGIRAWYEVTSLDVDFRHDKFMVLKDKQEIPSGADFVAIIDVIIGEEESNQKVMILPIYKLP